MKTRSAVALVAVGVSVLMAGFYGCSRTPPPKPVAETERL
jgi:hypothetical protein